MEVHVCMASTLLTKLSPQHHERRCLMKAPRYVPPTTGDVDFGNDFPIFLCFLVIFLISNH